MIEGDPTHTLTHTPTRSCPPAAIPVVPRVPIATRVATMADIPFMDALQKKHSKQLGYFPTKQFEGYVEGGHVLVACRGEPCVRPSSGVPREGEHEVRPYGEPVGYIIAKDRYLKRDELGVIFQLCVSPHVQRGLIGAALLREVFARSAYGCRLYCCWCAQDLAANHFWESMGFVPLAFRAGSDRKRRVHIFWQKRICQGDAPPHGTPWWYPCKTDGGAIRADRLVWPIPPGVDWREVRADELPVASCRLPVKKATRELPNRKHGLETRVTRRPLAGPGPGKVGILVGGKIKYVDRPGYVAPVSVKKEDAGETPAPRAKRARAPKEKAEPALLAKVRELRDRCLERVNTAGALSSVGKYDVARALPNMPTSNVSPAPRLPGPRAMLPAA